MNTLRLEPFPYTPKQHNERPWPMRGRKRWKLEVSLQAESFVCG